MKTSDWLQKHYNSNICQCSLHAYNLALKTSCFAHLHNRDIRGIFSFISRGNSLEQIQVMLRKGDKKATKKALNSTSLMATLEEENHINGPDMENLMRCFYFIERVKYLLTVCHIFQHFCNFL